MITAQTTLYIVQYMARLHGWLDWGTPHGDLKRAQDAKASLLRIHPKEVFRILKVVERREEVEDETT